MKRAWLLLAAACGPSALAPREPTREAPPPAPALPAPQLTIEAPRPLLHLQADPLTRLVLDACGGGDAALAEMARARLDARTRGEVPPSLRALSRRFASPYVAPRELAATLGEAARPESLRGHVDRFVGALRPPRRCGVAVARVGDASQVVALAAEAGATLSPVPRTARVGQWITVDATLLTHATGAKLLLLGPSGRPRPVPTAFEAHEHGGHARARFAPDRPGAFLVQLLAELEDGPRPVLEFRVYADVPAATDEELVAPGETSARGADAAALFEMVGAARASEDLPPLIRDPALDRLCKEHVARMARSGRIAHDAGDGDPALRAETAGVRARAVGENVARAATLKEAHRVLWASPSHRANVLSAEFTHVGVAETRAPEGGVVVCEMFATDPW